VSDTFIDRVTDLAEELGGNAEQLVEALYEKEVNRFHQNKAEDLKDYLRESGYIVSREPLDNDEIRIRVTDRLMSDDVPRDQAVDRVGDLLARIAEDKQDD
jgi:hypothetical protein